MKEKSGQTNVRWYVCYKNLTILVHLLRLAFLHFGEIFLTGDRFFVDSLTVRQPLRHLLVTMVQTKNLLITDPRKTGRVNASIPPHIVRFAFITWADKILHRVVRVPDLCPGLTPPGLLSRHDGQTFLSTHSYTVLSLQALFIWQLQQTPLVWLLRNQLSLSSPSIFLVYPILPKLSSLGVMPQNSISSVCVCLSNVFSLPFHVHQFAACI